eukprot:scaffold61582_cov50-Phaeocystis_antarctica.AAC.1
MPAISRLSRWIRAPSRMISSPEVVQAHACAGQRYRRGMPRTHPARPGPLPVPKHARTHVPLGR